MTRPALVLFIVQLLYCTLATGQTNKFEVGFEGGPSLTYLRGNDNIKEYYTPNLGYSGGITFQYNFPKIVSLRSGLSFERKGAQGEIELNPIQQGDPNLPSNNKITLEENFDYLVLPILARVSFVKKVKFLANLGPYFGFLIKQTGIDEYDYYGSTRDQTENFEIFDTGITGGIGVSLTIKDRFILSFEGRHNLGLYNTSKLPVLNDGSIMTNSTNFLFGFAYGLGARKEK